MKKNEEIGIEASFEKLEEILQKMQRDDIPLEEAFTCYEEGMKLLKSCSSAIDRVEKKVLKLSGDGTLTAFEGEAEPDADE